MNMQYEVPAYLQGAFAPQDDFSAGIGSQRGPHITVRNSRFFTVGSDGSETLIMFHDPQHGYYIDLIPVAAGKGLSNIYYKYKYVPGQKEPPTCFSKDGVYPDRNSTEVQARSCAECQWSAWGSAVNEQTGKPSRACNNRKLIAVLAVHDLQGPLYEFSISPVNLGPWGEHIKQMQGRNLPVQAVVTRVYINLAINGGLLFGPAPNYQTGTGIQFLPAEFLPTVKAAMESEECKAAIGGDAQPATPDMVALNAPGQTAALPPPQTYAAAPAAPAPGYAQQGTYANQPSQQSVAAQPATAQPGFTHAMGAPQPIAHPGMPAAPVAAQPAPAAPAEAPRRTRRTKAEMEADAQRAAAAAQPSASAQPPQQPQQPAMTQPGFGPAPQAGFGPPAQPAATQPGFGPAPNGYDMPPIPPALQRTAQPGFGPAPVPAQPGFGPASQPAMAQPGFTPQSGSGQSPAGPSFGVVTNPGGTSPEVDALLAQVMGKPAA